MNFKLHKTKECKVRSSNTIIIKKQVSLDLTIFEAVSPTSVNLVQELAQNYDYVILGILYYVICLFSS